MLKNYLSSLNEKRLSWLLYKADKQFWRWVNLHYASPSVDTAYQIERWRRINHMVYDEMYSEERIKRNG